MTAPTISVVGLGKLGLPLAVCLASKGFRVIGVDRNRRVIELINGGYSPIYEPGLEKLIHLNRKRFFATSVYEKAISESEITFILVPTPSNKDGSFSLKYILDACRHIGDILRKKQSYHLVVLTSTVSPGSTNSVVRPSLEKYSRKRCGKDFGLCYNPEFVALGSVISNLLNPDFVLIGESDSRSGAMLERLYGTFCENAPPVARMNFINAEIAKLAVNTFTTTKISFANMLSRICEKLPDANVDTVTYAVGLDSRIGKKYLKGAISYGGPCFPRDNRALVSFAYAHNVWADLAEATDVFNRRQISWLSTLVKKYLTADGKVGILGLAYKPNTDVVEESQGLLLAKRLMQRGIKTIVYDPAAMKNARPILDGSVIFASSASQCIDKTDVVVVSTPWPEFKSLNPPVGITRRKSQVVIDCWRWLDGERWSRVIRYIPLGLGSLPDTQPLC